jgi:hypothetical protein
MSNPRRETDSNSPGLLGSPMRARRTLTVRAAPRRARSILTCSPCVVTGTGELCETLQSNSHWHNSRMLRRCWLSRFASWATICALVLRAAVPLLAAGAAQLRGVSVAGVCPIYGVALPGASADKHTGHEHHLAGHSQHEDGPAHSGAVHTGDHCALTALAALTAPCMVARVAAQAQVAVPDTPSATCSAFRDACATWVARLKHGPPAFA